uniref:VWFA domain-containing protein n=1 Tax=Ciona savignyi TaxID=51511 RepID=H2YZH3_CIOSA
MLVTHVNQTLAQTSEEWLQNHDLSYQKITLKDLLLKGKQAKKSGNGKHLVFDASVITEMEYKLNMAIEQYHKRVKWLLKGSKKLFGLVKGDRVGVLIDSSDANTGFGRLQDFQQSLLHLMDEQLKTKKSLFMLSFGSELECLWNNAMDLNLRTIEEARDFIRGLHPSGGCNLLKAFKKILQVKDLNSILIILGNCPDQTSSVLFDYVQQCLLCRDLPVHAVAYDTSNHLTHETLKKLADHSKGRYHCYNSSDDREVYKVRWSGTECLEYLIATDSYIIMCYSIHYSKMKITRCWGEFLIYIEGVYELILISTLLYHQSFDIQLLLKEAQRAVDVISKIKQMRTGMLGDALVSIENEVKYSSVGSFIYLLYLFYQKAMQQFEWHDGSTKNVHVDVAMLYEYQKQLGSAVKTYERRIEWLASGSRKIWGTICEKRVILLVDTSVSNQAYIIHLQHSLRLLMEQQLGNKQAFNIIAYGSHPKMWKPHMVKPNPENLQSAWNWVQNLAASGGRNFMSAFRAATENGEDIKMFGGPQALYVISSGIPDQEEDVVCSFVSECTTGSELKLHTVLFSIDDYSVSCVLPTRYATTPQTADYLRNLAHSGNGRFHWFRETGVIESDDVTAISREMDRAVHYSQRCSMLVDNLSSQMICNGDFNKKKKKTGEIKQIEFIEPRPTALTLARMV